MRPTKWDRLQELFDTALRMERGQRDAFLDDACGADQELRRELSSLLAAQGEAGSFIEAPADGLQRQATLSPGSRLGPYEVVALIGKGGMGEVYRARDPRLGRDVALKLLPPDLSCDPDRVRRFEHEVRAASALNHPAILTVHDIGRADGSLFMVTELIEGRTLKALRVAGEVPAKQLVTIASQIAGGLAKAHAAGIVHRDLKPDNVMVTDDGFAKILDFGLAKLLPPSAEGEALPTRSETLSRSGLIMGTIGYMSPEQARGEPVDYRSDQFSLGVVLYEMATGTRPFGGRSLAECLAALLTCHPADIDALNPTAPAGLGRIVARCLAKQPAERYASTQDLAHDLEALRERLSGGQPLSDHETGRIPLKASGTRPRARIGLAAGAAIGVLAAAGLWRVWGPGAGEARAMIAVLPFQNLSGNPDLEYLSDGFTEEVLTLLGQRYASLGVIARTSVMRYKRTEKTIATIGLELAVDYILEGSVRQSPDRLRVSAQLIRVSDQTHLWAESFDRPRDILAVQDEVARRVAEAIHLRTAAGSVGSRAPATTDPRAHEFYLKGRYFWNKYTEDGWNKAIEHFGHALDIDRNHAPAWAGIADSYYQLSSLVLPPAEAIPKARSAALTALKIDDRLADAHASLGMIKSQYDWDLPGAKAEFDRAIELNPNYATAHQWLGMYYFADGRFTDAQASFERARQLDPLSLFIAVTAVWPLPHLGQYEEADRRLEKIAELYPDVPDVPAILRELRGDRHLQQGRPDEAVGEWLQGFRTKMVCGDGPEVVAALLQAYRARGLVGYWEKQLELAQRKHQADLVQAQGQQPSRYVSPFRLAELHALLGKKDQAFAILERCVQSRDENLRWLKAESLRSPSSWDKIRPDPRFGDLLRRIGLEP